MENIGSIIFQCFYSVVLTFVTALNISSCKCTKRQALSAISISTAITVIIGLVRDFAGFVNLFFLCFVAASLFWKTRDILSSAAFSVLSTVVVTVSMQVALFIYYSLFKVESLSIYAKISIFQSCFFYITLAIITYLISKFVGVMIQKGVRNMPSYLDRKYKIYISLGFFAVAVFFYYQLFVAPNIEAGTVHTAVSSAIGLIVLFLLLGSVYMFIIGVSKSLEIVYKQNQLLQLQAYNDSVEKINCEMRSFRHDYKNILASMSGYIKDENWAGLTEYFNNSILPISQKLEEANSNIDRLMNIKICELKELIASKLIQAQEWDIQVHIEVPEVLEAVNFDMVSLSRVLGNYLDNAMEACMKAENPVLKFAAIKEDAATTFLIVNSVSGALPQVSEMEKEGFSMKGEGRGLGLYSVRKILDQNEQAISNTIIKNGEFMQELRIANKNMDNMFSSFSIKTSEGLRSSE